jgi:hypothetical protein
MAEDFLRYKESEKGNFRIIDSIGVPHPYCIGAKHVAFAADNFHGMLGEAAIEEGEKQNIFCEICKTANRKDGKTILTYSQHEKALVVQCNKDININEYKEELTTYLKSIIDLATHEEFVGFAFKKNC